MLFKKCGCSAVSSSNSSSKKNLSLNHLSKLTGLRKKWLQAMRRVDIEEDQKVVLCSAQFNSEDFKRD